MAMQFLQHYPVEIPGMPYSIQGFDNDRRWASSFARSGLVRHGLSKSTETKPRLAKDEVERLEAEFRKCPKPNGSVKKGLAEQMRVDIARINNWFQNRRAKAKQEKKAHEMESKHRGDKRDSPQATPNVKEFFPSSEQHKDLHPSSAAFPTPDDSMRPYKSHSSLSETTLQVIDQGVCGLSNSPSQDSSSQFRSLESLSPEMEEPPFNFVFTDSNFFGTGSAGFPSSMLADSPESIAEQIAMTMSDPMSCSMQESGNCLQDFVPFPGLMLPDPVAGGLESFSPEVARSTEEMALPLLCQDIPHPSIEPSYHISPKVMPQSSPVVSSVASTPDLRFRSPPALDIASRRNRPQVAPISLRTSSFQHAPKTGFEFPRRPDAGSPMRRVASATGHVRIQKPISAAPCSPYFDRRHEAFLNMVRSPVMNAPMSSMAPPTPNTPVILGQYGIREATASSTPSEDEKTFAYGPGFGGRRASLMDPTLRTPPATPGLLTTFPDAVYQPNTVEAAFNFAIDDQPLHTPGLGSFETEFQLPSYGTHCGPSQPPTPSFPPARLGSTGFTTGLQGNKQEYVWSEVSPGPRRTSTSPSITQETREIQFNNLTPQDFGRGK